jgi:phytoene synthase
VSFDEDMIACAGLVQRGDPDRFMAAMASPIPARHVLFPLYAMNVEVSRAPWVSSETMIAEIRLQWWRDVLQEIAQGGAAKRHEVVTPLAQVLNPEQALQLDILVAVRGWDIYKDPFDDTAHFEHYIDQTSGTLMWTTAQCLGQADEVVVRDFAYAAGLANWLRAVPHLQARGRVPLLDDTPQGLRDLASDGLARLKKAQSARSGISQAAVPALLAGWQAETVLRQVQRDPGKVAAGALGTSELRRRFSLMTRVMTGRW